MKFVHSLFCGAERLLTVHPQWRSYALELLRLNIPETWKHLPSWDGPEFVTWFLFVYVSVKIGVQGSMDPWSMEPVHILMDPVHGPGPQRGSMDPRSMFCTFPNATSKSIKCDIIQFDASQSNMRLNFDSWFKRRILHMPNWIEIKLNNLCLLESGI